MTRIFNYLIPIFLVYRVIQLKSTVSVLREEKLTGKAASGPISEAATRGDKAAERAGSRGAGSKSRERSRGPK